MIPKIKKILYATDLRENSAYAFRYAINSAVHHDAWIHILHVMEYRILSFPTSGLEGKTIVSDEKLLLERLEKYDMERKKRSKEDIQKRLEVFCRQELEGNQDLLRHIGAIEITEGDAAEQILKMTEGLKPDLLVMGTHGKGWLAHAFLGSVAESVLHRAKIPVVIIPIPGRKDPAGEKG
jgi:nucleotide-binding universal stress UspA family protein